MPNLKQARDEPDNWADYCDQIATDAFLRAYARGPAGFGPRVAGGSAAARRAESGIATGTLPAGWIPADRHPEIR